MRTREEKAQDEREEDDREAHLGGYCEPDYCFWCIEAREQELLEEQGKTLTQPTKKGKCHGQSNQ